jgi:DamX protein
MTALGLQKDPFSPESDSQFYYSFDTFEQRLRVLQGLVQGADLFVLVIGEPGSGKTTLLNRYLASAGTQCQLARIHMDPEPTATPSSEPRADRTYPAYILQDSANPIVIVDDAHRLPRQELDFLIHEALVPGSSNKIKRLVLFGESNLYAAVTELAESLSAQPAFNKIYLPGLTEKQTAEYLQHRLAIGGYAGDTPFDPATITSIHRSSGGYPGPINEIACQWLKDKYSDKTERPKMLQIFSGSSRRMLTWFAAGIIILLLAAVWFYSERKPWTPKAPDQKLAKTVFRKKIVQPRKSADPTISQKTAAATPPQKPPAAIKTPPIAEAETTAEAPAPIITAAPEQKEPLMREPTIAAVQKSASPGQIESQPAAKPTPKTDSLAKPELQPAAKPTLETGLQPKIALQPAPEPTPDTPARPQTAARQIRRERWLLSQDADFYTIQIIGVSNEKSMLDFINKNQLLKQNEIAYYESTFNGKPWFQALFGLYPTKQAARRAADKLPENIRWAGPWIRKLSEVQQAIADR